MAYLDIITRLIDLKKQAVTEHAHYYIESCVGDAIEEILSLRSQLIDCRRMVISGSTKKLKRVNYEQG